MERKRINSSKLRAVGYDERVRSLEVKFVDGKIMVYANVSPEVHRGLMSAPSATSYFDDKIAEEFTGRRLRKGNAD